MHSVDLRKVILVDANLEKTDLTNANLEGADFRNADLRGVKTFLVIQQLAEVKRLYKAELDPELMEQVKEKCPHLLKNPKVPNTRP